MQILNDYEIDAVNGGSRVIKALDYIGRALTALEVGKAVKKVGDALQNAKGTHDTSNPLAGNRNAK